MARPKKQINPDAVRALARLGCTWEEIAGVLQIARGTFSARMKEKKYREAYDHGIAEGDVSIRRAQYDAAIGGKTAMLIWLGKNRLNQTDRIEQTTETTLNDADGAGDRRAGAIARLSSRGRADEIVGGTK